MKNLGQMMRQAQEMQERLAQMQASLAELQVTGTAGGGMVEVTVTGKTEAKRVKIDPSLFDGNEVGVLEDLLVAAFNDARGKVEVQMAERMSELTGGLPLPPGFKLPF
jgi:DNA-binding YbaB/EbfC family protein